MVDSTPLTGHRPSWESEWSSLQERIISHSILAANTVSMAASKDFPSKLIYTSRLTEANLFRVEGVAYAILSGLLSSPT